MFKLLEDLRLKILKLPVVNRIKSKTGVIITLIIWAGIGGFYFNFAKILPQILISAVSAVSLDFLILKFFKKKSYFPDAALISGLIIAMVLPPQSTTLTIVIAVSVAILGRHLIKIKGKHIFNPAKLGILAAILLFKSYDSWWGASNLWALIILGIGIVFIQNKFEQVLSFFFVYFGISILGRFLQGQSEIANLSQVFYENYGLYFFSFIILIEPQTSLISSKKSQAIFGVIAGFLSALFSIFQINPYLIWALFLADLTVPLLNRIKIDYN